MDKVLSFVLSVLAWFATHPLVILVFISLYVIYRLSESALQKHVASVSASLQQQNEIAQASDEPAFEPEEKPRSHPALPTAPDEIDGKQCVYHYQDVSMKATDPDTISNSIGKFLDFSVIGESVWVIIDGKGVGTLNSPKLGSMVSDWIDNGDPIFAFLTHYHENSGSAFFDLYFYRSDMDYLLSKDPEAKMYKLIGNTSEEKQSDIALCVPGAECSVEYDYDKDKYSVSSGWLSLGYLPAPAAKIIEEKDEESPRVFVANIETDESDTAKVFVYVFV